MTAIMAHLIYSFKSIIHKNKSLEPQIPYKCSILDVLVMEKRRSLSALHARLISTKGEETQ